jgi:RNA-binding protein YhbY
MEESRKSILKKARQMPILVRIGKLGITAGIVFEIKRHLKKKGIVKVKLLTSFASEKDRFEVARALSEKTLSSVLDVKGFVIALYRGHPSDEDEGNSEGQ